MKITLYTPHGAYVYTDCTLLDGKKPFIYFNGYDGNKRRTIYTTLPCTIEVGEEAKGAAAGAYDGQLVNNLVDIADKVRRVV